MQVGQGPLVAVPPLEVVASHLTLQGGMQVNWRQSVRPSLPSHITSGLHRDTVVCFLGLCVKLDECMFFGSLTSACSSVRRLQSSLPLPLHLHHNSTILILRPLQSRCKPSQKYFLCVCLWVMRMVWAKSEETSLDEVLTRSVLSRVIAGWWTTRKSRLYLEISRVIFGMFAISMGIILGIEPQLPMESIGNISRSLPKST